MSLPVIAIDGPAGVGKSTIAKLVAAKFAVPCLNTGAMFRTLALKLGDAGLALNDDQLMEQGKLYNFTLDPVTSILYCNNNPVGNEIHGEKVAALASAYAARRPMRELLAHAQRQIARATPLVAEGRDMGTVVFPDAKVKFFLDATVQARAMRRFLELQAAGEKPDLKQLEQIISQRDEQDRNRSIAPLKPAADAIIIDTSNLTIDQVLAQVVKTADSLNFV